MQPAVQAVLVSVLAGLSVWGLASLVSPSAKSRRIKSYVERSGAAAVAGEATEGLTWRERLADIVVGTLNLRKWLELDTMREKLQRAGKRGTRAETMFLMARFSTAVSLAVIAAFYAFVLHVPDLPMPGPLGIVFFAGYVGLKIPETVLDRAAQARAASIKGAWPDALDLMLILVEAGKTVEFAFRRVVMDIGGRSQPLAEELAITLAELSFLPERRQAYENLGLRTGVSEVRSTCMAVIQAEEQGTSLGSTFRALAADGRAARMAAAEKKGASIATFMTLPVMIFFLPPLIILSVIPALIDFMKWN